MVPRRLTTERSNDVAWETNRCLHALSSALVGPRKPDPSQVGLLPLASPHLEFEFAREVTQQLVELALARSRRRDPQIAASLRENRRNAVARLDDASQVNDILFQRIDAPNDHCIVDQ